MSNSNSKNGHENKNGIRLNKRNKALNQRDYRKRIKEKGLRQINVNIPQELYKDLYALLKLDKEDLESIIKISKQIIKGKPIKPQPILVEDTQKSNVIGEIDDDFFTGNFAQRFTGMTKGYKYDKKVKVYISKDERQKDRNFIEKLSVIINETGKKSLSHTQNDLSNAGYYTRDKQGNTIAPTKNSIKNMREKLIKKNDKVS